MNIILFYVWCASIAGDTKTYLVAAESKDAAFATVSPFMRQDWNVHPATLDEAIDLGAQYIEDDVVVFEDNVFKYNNGILEASWRWCVSTASSYMSTNWTEHFFVSKEAAKKFSDIQRENGKAVLFVDRDSY